MTMQKNGPATHSQVALMSVEVDLSIAEIMDATAEVQAGAAEGLALE